MIFAMPAIPYGDYLLAAEKEGYTSAWEEVTVRKTNSGWPRARHRFNVPLYPELKEAEALWGGVNNADIFDESGSRIDEMLDQMAKANLRVLRVLIDFRLEMDEWGEPLPENQYNDCILNWIDRLMLKAREKGILLMITLQIHNWILRNRIDISEEFYKWRNCKTPYYIFEEAEEAAKEAMDSGATIPVYGPYAERGWSSDFLTNDEAKEAYRNRVYHILNHYNHFIGKKWKDINDVVWAWGLQGEPDLLPDATHDVLRNWFNEMATYVKSIDPDTYVVLGSKYISTALGIGNIVDADIYTIHAYEGFSHLDKGISDLDEDIQDFQREIGEPYGKLLMVQEFNPGAEKRHTPDYPEYREPFEAIMEVCRRNGVPWMFWEYGYWFDLDDIWHANEVTSEGGAGEEHLDGVFWGAKVLPAAKRIWQTSWDWGNIGKSWRVHEKVDDICFADYACDTSRLYFIDTFSGGQLSAEYEIIDEDKRDSYFITTGSPNEYGYLRIEAGKYQDFWDDASSKTGAPIVLREVPVPEDTHDGSYSVETFVSADPLPDLSAKPLQQLNTQMGLFVIQDLKNWIFFGLTRHDFTSGEKRIQGDGLILTVTENGKSSIVTMDDYAEDFVFLKIDKYTGFPNGYRFSWKRENGEPWQYWFSLLFTFENDSVGMGVKTLDVFPETGYPCRANFDYFQIGSP
jgi:hypothetical protein